MPQRSNSARYLWGDRNPVVKTIGYSNTVAPHANTERASYTVPTGSKAILQNAMLLVAVITAAGPAGTKYIYFRSTLAATARYLAASQLGADSNTVGMNMISNLPPGGIFLAGDDVKLDTGDSGTGGTINYVGHIYLIEYTN